MSLTVDRSGQFVYVANRLSNNVSMYALMPDGRLRPLGPPVPAGEHPWSVTVDPTGQFVYVANTSTRDEHDNPVGNVSMYAITPNTGWLRSLGTVKAGVLPIAVTTK
jgi:6-phosphogluconolactonase